MCNMLFVEGNGNKDGLFSVLLRDYNSHAAASCMNRLAKLRYLSFMSFYSYLFTLFIVVHSLQIMPYSP